MDSSKWSSFDIVKSVEDKREYKGYVLSNKMKVVLISDPSSEKAAAAVDVHVGKCVCLERLYY